MWNIYTTSPNMNSLCMHSIQGLWNDSIISEYIYLCFLKPSDDYIVLVMIDYIYVLFSYKVDVIVVL